MKEFIVAENGDLTHICNEIIQLKTHSIFLLTGDLGTGKTTFSKSMISALGCLDKVTSPTFSIINEYAFLDKFIYHIDLYRLNNIQEAMDIGIEDYLYSGYYCFIEWPNLIKPLMPIEHHSLEIHILEDNKRKIIFK